MAFSRNFRQLSSSQPVRPALGRADQPWLVATRQQEAADSAGPTGTWDGCVFRLRKFVASPGQGRAGDVKWTQSMGKIQLCCVFSASPLAEITAKGIELQMSSWELKVRARDRPDLTELLAPICGDLFGDVRRELSWWTWEVAEGTATFTMEMTKRDLKAWKGLWRVGMNIHRKQHFGWNDRMKAPAKPAAEMLVRVMPGRPSWVDIDPGPGVYREKLNPSFDSLQTHRSATIRLHLEAAPLDLALERVGLEDLFGVDVMEKYIRIFIRGDGRNPLILAELGGRVVPGQTTFEFDRPVDLQSENMSALIVKLAKHPDAPGLWPDNSHNGVIIENLCSEMSYGEAPESVDELPKMLLLRRPRPPSPNRSHWTPAQHAAESKGKGDECFKHNDWRDAAVHYSRAISHCPTDPKLFSNRAGCYLRLNKFEKALENSKRSIALDSSWAKAYFRQGQAFRGLQQWNEARSAFAEGRFLDPDNAQWVKEIQKTDEEEARWQKVCKQQRLDKREADMTTELNEATSKAESEVIARVVQQALQAGRSPKEAAAIADEHAQRTRDRLIAEKQKEMTMMLEDDQELDAPPLYRILNEDGTVHPKGFNITKDGKYFMGLVNIHTEKPSETQPWVEIRHPGRLRWSQNCTLIRLKVHLPNSVRGAADISVQVFSGGIRIKTISDADPIVEGIFERRVDPEGENFSWYLVPDERPPMLEMCIDKDQAEIYATTAPIYLLWDRLFDDDVKLGEGLFEADMTDLPPRLLEKVRRHYQSQDEASADNRARHKFMTEREIADEIRGTWRGEADSYGMPTRRVEDWQELQGGGDHAAEDGAEGPDSTAQWDRDLGKPSVSPPRPPGRNWTRYSDADEGEWWHYDGPLGQWWCYVDEDPSPYEADEE